MSRRQLYNLLVILPLIAAAAFGVGVWQNNGQLPGRDFLKTNFSLSGFLGASLAQAQVAGCTEPIKSGAGEGRIYFSQCLQEFRMSKNAGDWESLGGSLWKKFVAPNQNDIYNTNTGVTYIKQDTIFGLSNIINGDILDQVIVLDNVNRNLIYGAVSIESAKNTLENQAASLLKLQAFNSANSVTPYRNLFNVRIDGKVIVGDTAGRLIVPEICLPNDSDPKNCISVWSAGGISPDTPQTTADKYWDEVSGIKGGIKNKNLADLKKSAAGGDVKITRNLDVNGSLYIYKNPNDISSWLGVETGTLKGSNVKGVWFDGYTSVYLFFSTHDAVNDSASIENSVSSDYGGNKILVLLALSNDNTNQGKVGVFRNSDTDNSSLVDFQQTNTIGGTKIMNVIDSNNNTAKNLNAVCSVGDPDVSAPKKYRIFAAGLGGEIWTFRPVLGGAYGATYLKHEWARLRTGAADDVWNAVECKFNDSTGSIYEIIFVGNKNQILRYNGSSWDWLLPSGNNEINAVWLQNRHHNAPLTPVPNQPDRLIARYYAADNKGNIYYWTSGSTLPSQVKTFNTGSTSNVFYAIGGQVGGVSSGTIDRRRWVYFGGKGGLIYRANMAQTDDTVVFEKLQNNHSTQYSIKGITGSTHHIYVALSDVDTNPRIGAGDSFLKSITIASWLLPNDTVIKPLADRSFSNWVDDVDGPLGSNKFISLSGYAFSTNTSNTFRNFSGVTLVLGSNDSLAFFLKQKVLKQKEDGWVDYKSFPWRYALNGENVSLYSVWRPSNTISLGEENTFMGGEKGTILRQGMEAIEEFTNISQTTRIGLDVTGLAGHINSTSGGVVYKVYATASTNNSSHLLTYTGSKKFKAINTTAYGFKLNGIWSNDSGNLIIAVGSNGNLLYCEANCDSAANWIAPATTLGTVDLLKVSGSGSTSFILTSAGKIYRCSGKPLAGNCSITDTLNNDLKDIWVNQRTNQAWAAGGLYIYQNTNISTNSWTEITPTVSLVGQTLKAVSGINKLIFFGGSGSKIIKYDGATQTWDFNSISSSSDLTINAISGGDGLDTITGEHIGKATAVGVNGIARSYILGGSTLSGDLHIENNQWGGSAGGSAAVNPTTGLIKGFDINPNPNLSKSSCPPGEFMVGINLDEFGVIDGLFCQRL